MFAKKEEQEGDEEDGSGDEEVGKGGNSPPSYSFDTLTETKPAKLTIESRPPEKSPYTKVFNVSQTFG